MGPQLLFERRVDAPVPLHATKSIEGTRYDAYSKVSLTFRPASSMTGVSRTFVLNGKIDRRKCDGQFLRNSVDRAHGFLSRR